MDSDEKFMVRPGPNEIFFENGEKLSSILKAIQEKWPNATLDQCEITQSDLFDFNIVRLVSPQ